MIYRLPSTRHLCLGLLLFVIWQTASFANNLENEQVALNQIDYLYSLNGKHPQSILEQLSLIVETSKQQGWKDAVLQAEVMKAEIYIQISDYKSAEAITKTLMPTISNASSNNLDLRLGLVELMLQHQHGNSERAQVIERQLLQSSSLLEEVDLKLNILLKVAYAQYLDSRLEDATKTYNLAYSLVEISDNQDALGTILVALGNIYSKQKEYEIALQYYSRAMRIAEALEQTFGIAVTAYNIGFSYLQMGNLIKSTEYLLNATNAYDQIGSAIGVAQSTNMLGKIAVAEERWSDAIELFQAALLTIEESGNIQNLFKLHLDLAKVNLSLKNSSAAERNLRLAESIFPQIEDKPAQQQFYTIASDIKASASDYESAYYFARKIATTQSDIFDQQSKQDTQRYLSQFNAQITEARNRALESENELQALKLNRQDEAYRLSIIIVVLTFFLFLATSVLLFFIARNRNYFKKLALVDHLTNAPNRRAILEYATLHFDKARLKNGCLAICILDLDRFKDINDNFGHDSGDAVLKIFAEKCKGSLRGNDSFGRYGGEEWLMVLEESSPQNIVQIFERLRALLNHSQIKGLKKDYSLTFSMGVAIYDPKLDNNVSDLIKRADKAVYEAKNSGRDKIVFSQSAN